MTTEDIGPRIRNRRKDIGMTQEELGKHVGVSKATINKYETGIVINIKRPMIEQLARALDVSPSYLVGWTDNINVETNNGVIGQNSGVLTVNNSERNLSKEELELLRIYSVLDVKGRIRLLQDAMKLEEGKY